MIEIESETMAKEGLETYKITKLNCGCLSWSLDGKLHREDGPALITCTSRKGWYREGLLHREDGPAMILSNFGKIISAEYRLDGKKYYWNIFLKTLEKKKKLIYKNNKYYLNDGRIIQGPGGVEL